MTTNEARPSFIRSILAIAAFVIIVLIGLWGAAQAFWLAPSVFSQITSLFSRTDDTISITLPSNIESGAPFDIRWEHKGDAGGQYAFSYRCREGFSFQMAKDNGTYSPIACETPTAVPSKEKQSLKLIPVSKIRFLDVPFVIAYFNPEGDIAAEGTNTATIINSSATSDTGTIGGAENGGTDTQPETPTQSAPPTKPDLTVRILETGIIDRATGAFIPKSQIFTSDIAAIRFEVKNAGGGVSGSWMFIANLPTNPPFEFTSKTQQSLGPQDRIEYTLRFDQPKSGGGVITIHVDPTNVVAEASENNNSIAHTIVVQ